MLIPRQDTETIVDTALKMFAGKKDITVIDLCSGSGCIGITLERKLDCGRAVCVEKSEKAAEYLRENISLNGSGAEIVMGDVTDEKLVEDMPEADLIVCNPLISQQRTWTLYSVRSLLSLRRLFSVVRTAWTSIVR